MSVRAFDLGSPQRFGVNQATVTINVIRNQNCPIFDNLPNVITIPRNQGLNTRIFDVNATDADPAVSTVFLLIRAPLPNISSPYRKTLRVVDP